MNIDVASDLHVDKHLAILDWRFLQNGHSKIVVIAGDVANDLDLTLQEIHKASLVYDLVLFVDGNHEHYKSGVSVLDQMKLMRAQLSRYNNVVYLDGLEQCTHQVEDVLFVGGNGWYDWRCFEHEGIMADAAWKSWLTGSNDANWIQWANGDNPATHAMVHGFHLAEAVRAAQLDPSVRGIVMITHTSPRHEIMERRSRDWDVQTPSFVNSQMSQVLQEDVFKKIRFWIYGHTHVRNYREVDHVTYVNNSRGYAHEERSAWFLPQIEV